MGLFDFFKSKKESVKQANPESSAVAPKDYSALPHLAAIISGGNEQVIADFTELYQDEAAFLAKHREWCDEICDMIDPDDRHRYILQVFAYWLTGYDTEFEYGAYIDWKEETGEITSQLQRAVNKLGYGVNVEESDFNGEEDTFEALKIIGAHLHKHGYALAVLDTNSDCYHLYVVPQHEYDKLTKLGESVGFIFSTPR